MRVELRQCSYRYPSLAGGAPAFPALQDADLVIGEGERIGIIGPSGSGKTTLIQLLNGLLQPDSGEVFVDGKPAAYRGEAVLAWRRRVGLVFQFPEMQFFEETVEKEVGYALANLGFGEEEIRSRVANVLNSLNLPPDVYAQRSPFLLSEGQKRRVAIASVLVMEPEILIFDEPTAGLDYGGVQLVKELILKLADDRRSVVLVSHDMDFVAELVDRVVVLSGGRIVFDGSKAGFFRKEETIRQYGLEPPRILAVARRLRDAGYPVPFPLFSLEELRSSLRANTA